MSSEGDVEGGAIRPGGRRGEGEGEREGEGEGRRVGSDYTEIFASSIIKNTLILLMIPMVNTHKMFSLVTLPVDFTAEITSLAKDVVTVSPYIVAFGSCTLLHCMGPGSTVHVPTNNEHCPSGLTSLTATSLTPQYCPGEGGRGKKEAGRQHNDIVHN